MSDLDKRNQTAIAASLRDIAEQLASIHGEIVELKKTQSQMLMMVNDVQVRQQQLFAVSKGTGPTG